MGILMECGESDVLQFIADPKLLKAKVKEVRGIIARYSMASSPDSSWASHEFDDPSLRTSNNMLMGDRNNDQQES